MPFLSKRNLKKSEKREKFHRVHFFPIRLLHHYIIYPNRLPRDYIFTFYFHNKYKLMKWIHQRGRMLSVRTCSSLLMLIFSKNPSSFCLKNCWTSLYKSRKFVQSSIHVNGQKWKWKSEIISRYGKQSIHLSVSDCMMPTSKRRLQLQRKIFKKFLRLLIIWLNS